MSVIQAMGRQQKPGEGFRVDVVFVSLTLAILLLGLVMVGSASVSMAAHEVGGNPFSYLERQLGLTLAGIFFAGLVARVPTDLLERFSFVLLLVEGLVWAWVKGVLTWK